MQNINDIQNFKRLQAGQTVTFLNPEWAGDQSRQIKFRVNAGEATRLYVTRIDDVDSLTGEVMFEMEKGDDGSPVKVYTDVRLLAAVPAGLTPVHFYYRGSFSLMTLDGDIWLETLEGGRIEVEPTDYVSYARVWEREEEDPRIQEMKRLARQNQRLLEQQMAADRAEREALYETLRKLQEQSNVSQTPNAGTSADQGSTAGGASVGATGDTTSSASTPAGTGGQSDAGA